MGSFVHRNLFLNKFILSHIPRLCQKSANGGRTGKLIGNFPSSIRNLTTTVSNIQHYPVPINGSNKQSLDYMVYWPELRKEIVDISEKLSNSEVANYVYKMLDYTVAEGGKKNRIKMTVESFEILAVQKFSTPPTAEYMKLATILGWIVEMMQGAVLLIDDIIDGSSTRRGKPSWYLCQDKRPQVMADGVLILELACSILKKYFLHMDCYSQLNDARHEAFLCMFLNQVMDNMSAQKSIAEFNMEYYKKTIETRTAQFSFYLPVKLAMILAGYRDPDAFTQARTVLLELGCFFQITDDYLDFYGDPAVTGKIGTDIQERKCSWLAVKFMELASPEQAKLFSDIYGSKDPKDVARVGQLYEEVDLKTAFRTYEEEFFKSIRIMIQQEKSCFVPDEVFLRVMDSLYHRNA